MKTTLPTLTAISALLLLPGVAAHHWGYDQGPEAKELGDSACAEYDAACYVDYLCIGGTPPQVVDTVLHCASKASGGAPAVAAWAPHYAWAWADAASKNVEEQLVAVHDAGQPTADRANVVLCGTVWSLFCSIPLSVPEHAPLADPVGPYTGWPL
jgi:hypothetical protein